MKTKKDKLFELFGNSFSHNSAEAKQVVKNYRYRYQLWNEWKQLQNLPEDFEFEPAVSASDTVSESETSPETVAELDTVKEPKLRAPLTVSPKQISIGNIKIPYNDWGYSTTYNLLLVAATYEEVCKPKGDGGFGYSGKVGDFCADCVLLFRRLFSFDKMKEEEYAGRELPEGSGEGEAVEQQ